VIRAAEAEAQARAAWRSVFRPPAALRAVIIPGAEEFGRLVYAVYLNMRRGVIAFEEFLLRREAVELIGDIARLAPEELTSLKAAYTQALAEAQSIAAHGQSLAMTEDEIHAFMRMWNNRRGMTAREVMQEMDAWRATRQSGVPFGFSDARHFDEFRSIAQQELARAMRRADPQAQAFLQGSSLSGVSYARQVPFDAESDLDVAIVSRYLFRRARTLGYEVAQSPSRIGPLDADQIAELGLGRMLNRMERALPEAGQQQERMINIMLFDNEAAMRAPIGSHSTETTRAAVPLVAE